MSNSIANCHSPLGLFPAQPTPRLYDRVVAVLRARHSSRRTEQTYAHWIKRFICFHTHVLNRGPAGVRSPVAGLSEHRGGLYADPYKTPR